jgi:splicing factor 3B subunit 3
VQGCVDGQLCEQYNLLPATLRKTIADALDRTPAEVAKRIEDLRNRVLL